MATIMEGALWTLTEAAAERMVEHGLLTKCERKHTEENLVEGDYPLYHVACDAPSWFGVGNMDQAIRAAEAHVEMPNEDELEAAGARQISDMKIHELTLDPTMNPEPGGPGSITVVGKPCNFEVCRCICKHTHIDTKYKIAPVVVVANDHCPVKGHGSQDASKS